MDSLFGRFFEGGVGGLAARGAFPSFDLSESEKHLTVAMELPGVDPDDVQIHITAGVLTVSGEKRQEHQEKASSCLYAERSYGSFRRSLDLPRYANADDVDATCKNGVLTIKIGKRADAQPKRIALKQA